MPFLGVTLCCVILYSIYLFASRLRTAAITFIAFFGYLTLGYFHYFGSASSANDNSHPFNEELIFTLIVLSFTALCFGLMAWWLHHRIHLFGEGRPAKYKSFAVIFVAFALIAGALIVIVPLSFDMPIDMKKCDASVGQPEYCL
jgi:hypothetical protein